MKHIKLYEEFINEAANGVTLKLKNIEDNEFIVTASKGGKEIGKLYFIQSKFKQVLKATSVSVDPTQRRQGIASSMYEFAEKELKLNFIKNDDVLTPDGKALWAGRDKK